MGLGILGGGVATARFLAKQGADLTVTDMKSREFLEPSLKKLQDFPNIKFVLGEHKEEDFLHNEIIVVNPDVPVENKFVRLARENGKKIENELSLFFKNCKSENTIGITGTRGKTTTTNWTAHLLWARIVGNSPENPFLGSGVESAQDENLVLEMPSFQLELLGEYVEDEGYKLSPHIAVITNLYRDHLNRHKTMEGYAKAKSNIFKFQNENDFLILNKENEWTDFFLKQNPRAQVVLVSKEDKYEFLDGEEFARNWGEHNLTNLLFGIVVARILGIDESLIKERISSLTQIKFRQEKIYDRDGLEIYNDTSATSPEGTMVAVERFRQYTNLVLIAGGTDRDLEYGAWANVVRKYVRPENLILIAGSATEKMKKELSFDSYNEHDTLEECMAEAVAKARESGSTKNVILFSPGAKSFEKFKNEFDRGEQFNLIVNKILS